LGPHPGFQIFEITLVGRQALLLCLSFYDLSVGFLTIQSDLIQQAIFHGPVGIGRIRKLPNAMGGIPLNTGQSP